jgi:hypothetical protein
MIGQRIASSFRDPDGFAFLDNGTLYRQINPSYKDNYALLINSGLYENLVDSGYLIPHEEVGLKHIQSDLGYKIIRPEPIWFISYPYEWCFSQLKEAALLTLKIQKMALEFGMTLKDGSAYNIQFRRGKAVLIDTLSFEAYREAQLWFPYQQICQHFIAPLALMSYSDVRLNQLLRVYIDGIPLDLASSLLPFKTKLNFGLFSHIHLHAKSQRRFANKEISGSGYKLKRSHLISLIDNLEVVINGLRCKGQFWDNSNYYDVTSYSAKAFEEKKQLVSTFLERINPKSIWDLGANSGLFSRIASEKGIQVVSFDCNHSAVEKNYAECAKRKEVNILPILLDLVNPSPGIGWNNQERMSLIERGPAEAALVLALIHHLAIANNLPFSLIADFLANICNFLIIEFIPQDDPQVQKLILTREYIFSNYNQSVFEKEFSEYFIIEASIVISDSKRIIYLMKRRKANK